MVIRSTTSYGKDLYTFVVYDEDSKPLDPIMVLDGIIEYAIQTKLKAEEANGAIDASSTTD